MGYSKKNHNQIEKPKPGQKHIACCKCSVELIPKQPSLSGFTNSQHVQKPAIFRYKRCIRDRKAQFAFRREQSNTLKMGRL